MLFIQLKDFLAYVVFWRYAKFVDNKIESTTAFDDFKNIYLDDMMDGLDDLRLLGSSIEGTSPLLYLINGSIKGINSYAKRLIETIRITLKNS